MSLFLLQPTIASAYSTFMVDSDNETIKFMMDALTPPPFYCVVKMISDACNFNSTTLSPSPDLQEVMFWNQTATMGGQPYITAYLKAYINPNLTDNIFNNTFYQCAANVSQSCLDQNCCPDNSVGVLLGSIMGVFIGVPLIGAIGVGVVVCMKSCLDNCGEFPIPNILEKIFGEQT